MGLGDKFKKQNAIISEKKNDDFSYQKSANLISDGKVQFHFLNKDDSGRNDGQKLRN